MRFLEAAERWYMDKTHARKTISSVIGAYHRKNMTQQFREV